MITQNKLLGNLYYDDTAPKLAEIPVKEIIEANSEREKSYLKTKDTINLIDTFNRELPKDISPDIYKNILQKVNENLSGINPDNYANKILDVQQLSNDIVNKYGGKELLEQKKLLNSKYEELDKAYKENKIVDPEFLNYKKQIAKTSMKPLSYDENGFITKPVSPDVNYAEYVDAQKLLNDQMKGWEADGSITTNDDGSITINKDLPGYLGVTNGTRVKKEELLKAGINYLKNDAKYNAYLEDMVTFKTRNIQSNAETLNEILTPEMKKALLGKSDADTFDIYEAIQKGDINPNKIVKDIYKNNELYNQAQFTADKYGYDKEELKFYNDNILLKSLEAQKEINIANSKSQNSSSQTDTAIITLEPFTTQRILNPTDINIIKENKNKLIEQRKNNQIELNSYQKGLNEKREGYSTERLELKQKQQDVLDNQIAEIEQQEKGLRKIIFDNGLKAGVNLDKTYENNYTNSKTIAKENNSKLLQGLAITKDNQFTVDISSKIIEQNKVPYLILDNNEKIPISSLQSIERTGSSYIYKPNAVSEQSKYNKTDNHNKLINELKSVIFEDNGSLSNNVKIIDKNIENKIFKVPNKSQYYEMVIDAFNNKKENNGLFNIDNGYFDRKNNLVISSKVLDDVDKIRKAQGEFQWELSQPLSYLLITGDTQKSTTKIFQNYEKAAKTDFITTPEQYNINVGGKLQGLGDHLKEKYGLPDLSNTYIDWDKTGFHTLVESDRNNGQLYGADIKLTKEGLEVVKDKLDNAFNNTNSIKLALVNPNKRYDAQIREQVVKSYPYLMNQDSEEAVNLKKEMGLVYINNSNEGKEIDSLNLYTMPSGTTKTINIKGAEYQISSTTKDATQSDLMNVDFHLDKAQEGQLYTLATNNKQSIWKPLSEVQKSKEWKRVIFESPSDIKAVIGSTLLETEIKNNKNSTIENPYTKYINNNNFYNPSPNQTINNNYKRIIKNVQTSYNNPSTITLINNNGKEVKIDSKIQQNELFDLRNKYKNIVESDVIYPYINKAIVSNLDNILSNYNLTITGGFRGEKTHQNLQDSVENSLHKYGLGLDFKANEAGLKLFNEIKNNPSLAKTYGIVNILKHGENEHIHVEFAPILL